MRLLIFAAGVLAIVAALSRDPQDDVPSVLQPRKRVAAPDGRVNCTTHGVA